MRRGPTVSSRHQPLLGTVVECHVRAGGRRRADKLRRAVVAEIRRLMAIFNGFAEESDLARYRLGDDLVDPALLNVIDLAETWKIVSGGVLDPHTEHLRVLWNEAAESQQPPDPARTSELIGRAADPPHDRSSLNLNAIAKGWIVDRALGHARALDDTATVWISAGGDIAHRGSDSITVGIEDPARPYDNVGPTITVPILNQAIATSGSARRGWTIAGERYSHLLDPRTGRPSVGDVSATVIAPDATTADALATVLAIDPDMGRSLVDAVPERACLIQRPGADPEPSFRWPTPRI